MATINNKVKNVVLGVTAVTTVVASAYAVQNFWLKEPKMSYNDIIVEAAKRYVEGNRITIDSSMITSVSRLTETGNLTEDLEGVFADSSYVKITNENGSYKYEPSLAYEETNSTKDEEVTKELTYKVAQSSTRLTNGNIEIQVIFSDEIEGVNLSGWSLSNDKKTLTKIYMSNEETVFEVRSLKTKETVRVSIEVTNIDKEAPVIKVNGKENNAAYYRDDVTVEVEDKNLIEASLNGVKSDTSYTISGDGQYDIQATDAAGNVTRKKLRIRNALPVANEVEDGGVYSWTKKRIGWEDPDVTGMLDSEPFYAYDEAVFDEEREYTLVLTNSIAGVSNTINFTIDRTPPKINGIIEGTHYNSLEDDIVATFEDATTVTAKLEAVGSSVVDVDYTAGEPISAPGTYILKATDAAGNTSNVKFVIDNEDPWVNGVDDGITYPGTRTITFGDNSSAFAAGFEGKITATLNGKEITSPYIVKDEATYELIVADQAGNKKIVNFALDVVGPKFEGTSATATYKLVDGGHYPSDLVITAKDVSEIKEVKVDGTPIENGNYTIGEGSHILSATDAAGNTTTITVVIDKTQPKGENHTITPSTPTNKPVMIKVVTNKPVRATNTGTKVSVGGNITTVDGVEYGTELTAQRYSNGRFTFMFVDIAGNAGRYVVNISNIDKDIPAVKKDGEGNFEIEMDEGYTNTGKTIILKMTEPVKSLNTGTKVNLGGEITTINGEDYGTELIATRTSNGTFTFLFQDAAGNKGSHVVNVKNIDKEKPYVIKKSDDASVDDVIITPEGPTNTGKEITIKLNEPVRPTNTGTVPTVGGETEVIGDYTYGTLLTAVRSSNGKYTFMFVDRAGNKGFYEVTVSGIDKDKPIVTGVEDGSSYKEDVNISFSDKNGENEVSATLNDGTVTGNSLTVSDEGEYTLVVTDTAGNATTVKFIIDKTAPTITGLEDYYKVLNKGTEDETLVFNKAITPKFNEGTAKLNGENYTSSKIKEDGDYTLVVTDKAGNSKTVKFKLDTAKPKFVELVSVTPEEPTNGSKTITIKVDKHVRPTNTGTIPTVSGDIIEVVEKNAAGEDVTVQYGTELTAVRNSIGLYTFMFVDTAGNVGTYGYIVEGIDKVKPTITPVSDGRNIVTLDFNDDVEVATAKLTTPSGRVIDVATGNKVAGANDTTVDDKIKVREDGEYTLVVTDTAGNDAKIKFTIDTTAPEVTGLEDPIKTLSDGTLIFDKKVSPKFTEGTATLDDKAYTSETEIGDKIGVYTLVVTDDYGNAVTYRFIIDTTDPTITGLESPVNVLEDGTKVFAGSVTPSFNEGTATLNDKSWDPTTISGEGPYELVVTDAAGNSSSVKFKIDTTNPAFSKVVSVTPDGPTNGDKTITIELSEEVRPTNEGTLPTIGGNIINAVKKNDDGTTETVEYGTTLTVTVSQNGDYTFKYVDIAGNAGEHTYTVTGIDTEDPTITPITSGKDIVTLDFSDNVAVDTAKLTTPSGRVIDVVSGDKVAGKNDTTEDDKIKVREDGTYTLVVTDTAGNSLSITFAIDTTDPEITGLENPVNVLEDGTKVFAGSVTPSFNEGTATLGGKDWTSAMISDEGSYELVVTDAAGNSSSVKFKIDTTDPAFSKVVSVTPDGPTNGSKTITIELSEEVRPTNEGTLPIVGGNIINAVKKNDDGTTGMVQYGTTLTITVSQNGDYTFKYVDIAGNAGEHTYTVTGIDTEDPTITPIADGKDIVTLDFRDNVAVDTAKLTTPSGNVIDVTTGDKVAGANDTTVDDKIVVREDGEYILVVTDIAGNDAEIKFTIDTTAPDVTGLENPIKTLADGTLVFDGIVAPEFTSGTGKITTPSGSVITIKSGDKFTGVKDTTVDDKIKVREDGLYTLVVADTYGNESSFKILIDTTAPTVGAVTASNKKVQNGQSYNEDITITYSDANSDGPATLNGDPFISGGSVSDEGTYTLIVTDIANNRVELTFTIDKTAPDVTGFENPVDTISNDDGTTTLVFDEKVTPVFTEGTAKLNGSTFASNTPVTDGTYTLVITDAAGNDRTVKFIVDTVSPTGTITGNPSTPTKGDVTLTLEVGELVTITDGGGLTWSSASEIKGSDGTINGYRYTATVSRNDTYTVSFEDIANHTGSASINVTNIDNDAPIGTITTDPAAGTWTNDKVTLTLEVNEQVTIVDSGLSWSTTPKLVDKEEAGKTVTYYQYTATTSNPILSGSVTFTDAAGNSTTKTYSVTNIDKEGPTATIESDHDMTKWTNENILLTLKPSEEITITDKDNGWVKDGDKNEYLLTVYGNGTLEVNFVDRAGNTGKVTYTVSNIDKDAPVGEIEYSTTDKTNQSVKIYLDVTEAVSISDINTDITWSTTYEKVTKVKDGKNVEYYRYTATAIDNTSGTVSFVDRANNSGSIGYVVGNIDTDAPVKEALDYTNTDNTTGPTKNPVKITLTLNEAVNFVKDSNGLTWTAVYGTDRKSYEVTVDTSKTGKVTVRDDAGNTLEVDYAVDNIDTTNPKGTITGNPSEPTTGDVTLTLEVDEFVTITNAGGLTWSSVQEVDKPVEGSDKTIKVYQSTATVSGNGTYAVEYVDRAGNTGSASIKVTNIDNDAPTATIKLSTYDSTNQPITLTLTPSEPLKSISEGWTKQADGTYTKVVSQKGRVDVSFEDMAGNTGSAYVDVTNFDDEAPTATITSSREESDVKNQDVTLTLTPSESIIITSSPNWTPATDGTNAYTLDVDQNGTITVTFKDLAGNTGSATYEVTNIDKTAPTISKDETGKDEVTITPEGLTNQDKTVTIKVSEAVTSSQTGVTVSADGRTLSLVATSDGSYTFDFTDLAGNPGSYTVAVSGIDKNLNVGVIDYSTKEWTNADVTVTLTVDEEVTISDATDTENSKWVRDETVTGFVYKKTIKSNTNGDVQITYTDKAGNFKTITYNVNNIDKSAPKVTNTLYIFTDRDGVLKTLGQDAYSTNTITTNGSVTVKLAFDEDVTETMGEGATYTNEVSITRTEGGKFTYKFYDRAGNPIDGELEITNIDTVVPTIKKDANGADMVSVITKNEDDTTNESSLTEITNKNKFVTITVSEPVTTTQEGVTVSSDKLTLTKMFEENTGETGFTFEFTDMAGNAGTYIVRVSGIDKTAPEIKNTFFTFDCGDEVCLWTEAEYKSDKTLDTRGPIDVEIEFDKEVSTTKGGTYSKYASFTYTENGDYSYTFYDRAGNEVTKTINIYNIDKVLNEGSISYSDNYPGLTNQSVVVTLTVDEEVTITDRTDTETNKWTRDTTKEGYVYTKTIESNTSADGVTITYKDEAGNSRTAKYTVTNIDKKAPTIKSTTYLFNGIGGNVYWLDEKDYVTNAVKTKEWVDVEIEFDKEVSETKGGEYSTVQEYSYTENGTYTYTFYDRAGNEITKVITIDNIDKTAPTIAKDDENNDLVSVVTKNIDGTTNESSLTEATNKTKVVTITVTEPITTSQKGVTVSADKLTLTKEFEANTPEGGFTFNFMDGAGNTGTYTIEVSGIDKDAPVASLVADITSATNQDVTLTLEVEGGEEITIVSSTHKFTKNPTTGKYQVVLKENALVKLVIADSLGNQTEEITCNVDYIDKTLPTITGKIDGNEISKLNGHFFNKPVEVVINKGTMTIDKTEILDEDGNPLKNYVVKTNGTHRVTVKDIFGNTSSVVFGIDLDDPEVTLNGKENKEYYNSAVTVSATDLSPITATISKDGAEAEAFTLGSTLEDEGTYTVVVTDRVGNTTTVIFTIDKSEPTVTWSKEPVKTMTDGTLVFDVEISATFEEGATATLDSVTYTKNTKIEDEGRHTLVVTNRAGTSKTFEFIVDIDAPVITVSGLTHTSANGNYINVIKGQTITYPTVTARDTVDGEVTVQNTGENIDSNVADEYTVTYTATDNAGHSNSVDLIVRVLDVDAFDKIDEYMKTLEDNAVDDPLKGLLENKSDYTDASWKIKADLLKEVGDLINSIKDDTYDELPETLTPAFIAGKISELDAKVLQPKTIDDTGYKKVVAEFDALNSEDYTDATYQTALAARNKVITGVNVQSDLNRDYTKVLKDAIDALEPKDIVEYATKKVNDAKTYTTEDYDGVTEYNDALDELLGRVISSGSDKIELKSEFDKLFALVTVPTVKRVDFTDLDNLEADFKALGKENYTSESWKTIEDKIAEARKSTLNSELRIKLGEIDLTTLVSIPTTKGDITVSTSKENGYVKEGDTVTIEFSGNVELDPAKTKVSINGMDAISVTEVGDKTYQAIIKIDSTMSDGKVSYTIDVVGKDGEVGAQKTGTVDDVIIDKTSPVGRVTKYDEKGNVVTDGYVSGKIKLVLRVDDEPVKITDENSGLTAVNPDANGYAQEFNMTTSENGEFAFNYVDRAGNTGTAKASVQNIDTEAPELVVIANGNRYDKDFEVKVNASKTGSFDKFGYEVSDKIDSSVTTATVVGEVNLAIIKKYDIIYTATDKAGNTKKIVATINVVDETDPVIDLVGAKEMTINYASDYSDAGATATDDFDGKLSVTTTGTVDPYKVGTYTITYTAKDSSGNTTKVVRTIIVRSTEITEVFRDGNGCTTGTDCYNTEEQDNYVWYSGHLWRVMKVNSNNTLRLITDDAVTGFAYDIASSKFTGSHADKWLNSIFYQSLNNASRVIADGEFCNEVLSVNTSEVRYTCSASNIVRTKVGLITVDEYNKLGGANSFLNNTDHFFTMTPFQNNAVWVIKTDGNRGAFYTTEPYALRPVINMNAIDVASGRGTKSDPFRISGDNSVQAGSALTSSKSGEYVMFSGKRWRVVSSSSEGTKLISDAYWKDPNEADGLARSEFGTVGVFSMNEGIGKYLNDTVYGSFSEAEKSVINLSRWTYNDLNFGRNPMDYTLVEGAKSTNAYVGLIRVGELMSGSSSTGREDRFTYWTINSNITKTWFISWGGTSEYSDPSNRRGIRPVIVLNSKVTISNGTGTYENPYELKLQ